MDDDLLTWPAKDTLPFRDKFMNELYNDNKPSLHVTDNYLLAFAQGLKSFLFSFFFLLFSLKSLLFLREKNNERPVNQATDFKPSTNCNKLLFYSIVFLSVFAHYILGPVYTEVGTPVR